MKEKPSTENEQKCCSGLELAVREQTLRICPLGIDHAERTFYNLLEFSTAYLVGELHAKGQHEDEDIREKRLPIAQQLKGRCFVS